MTHDLRGCELKFKFDVYKVSRVVRERYQFWTGKVHAGKKVIMEEVVQHQEEREKKNERWEYGEDALLLRVIRS